MILRRMLLAGLLLAGLLLVSPLHAAEPVAKIAGPSRGAVGERLLYDLSGSVSDDEPLSVQFVGPAQLTVWYDASGKPGLAVVVPAEPGSYFLAVVAGGVPEGKTKPAHRFAFWQVVVGKGPVGPVDPVEPVDPVDPVDPPSPPSPPVDYDPAFVPVGKALAAQFGPDFGKALEDGAKLLDAGQGRDSAEETIRAAFTANRRASFERIAGAALGKVVPPTTPDAKLTAGDRKALARAYRGLRKGAEGR
jgi:hypothetical protein